MTKPGLVAATPGMFPDTANETIPPTPTYTPPRIAADSVLATDILELASPLIASEKKASAGVSRSEILPLPIGPGRGTNTAGADFVAAYGFVSPLAPTARMAKVRGHLRIPGKVWRPEAVRTSAEEARIRERLRIMMVVLWDTRFALSCESRRALLGPVQYYKYYICVYTSVTANPKKSAFFQWDVR